MFNELENKCDVWNDRINDMSQYILYILLGKQPENVSFDEMLQVWLISGKYISTIYKSVVTGRAK